MQKTTKKGVSQTMLFLFFISFTIIMSLWTSIGTHIMSRWTPAGSSVVKSVIVAIIITIIFAWVISKVGLNLTVFENIKQTSNEEDKEQSTTTQKD